ncbi:MAG: hypothetical protein JWP87_1867 [Labilithrix sp.]|nr:hypothetical protein [Labilithrix sp.]
MVRSGLRSLLLACVLAFSVVTACKDPTRFDTTPTKATETVETPENCPASAEWLPSTPALDQFEPLPHPETECPFYRGAWQSFLVATQPGADGEPAFRSYPTIDDLFVSSKPHGVRNTAQRAWLGDIKQAGGRQILIDQRGRSIYYGIHTNQAFADFVDESGLKTVEGIKNASPTLFFPAGVVEFKSAWQDIEGVPAADYEGYITTTAWVPHLTQDPATHRIVEDKNEPRLIKVALLALHVVFTLPGHPEFIWATFEHVNGAGDIDNAPASALNPTLNDPYNLKDTGVACPAGYPLCKAGTKTNQGNQPLGETDLHLDEASQSFPGQQTSIYRMYPGSKSNGIDADEAIGSLNTNMKALFAQKAPNDKRGRYKLIGATWMDKPAFFKIDSSFQNDQGSALLQNTKRPEISQDDERKALLAKGISPTQDLLENGSDSPFSLLAGEDRLSSTAMESFTQSPAAFPNCFACHNTQAVTARGIPSGKDTSSATLLPPKLINISHVFSQFVLEETQ